MRNSILLSISTEKGQRKNGLKQNKSHINYIWRRNSGNEMVKHVIAWILSSPCPQFTCWSPTPQCPIFGHTVFKEVIKLNVPGWLMYLQKEKIRTHKNIRDAHAKGKSHVRMQYKSGHLQGKERDFSRARACWHLDLGLLAPTIVRKYISVF